MVSRKPHDKETGALQEPLLLPRAVRHHATLSTTLLWQEML